VDRSYILKNKKQSKEDEENRIEDVYDKKESIADRKHRM
jgi:hypothetical protein